MPEIPCFGQIHAQAMELPMTNRKIVKSPFRVFVEQFQHADKVRAAFARVRAGKEVRRRDAGVLRTIARGC
jgi:hypothetical protein